MPSTQVIFNHPRHDPVGQEEVTINHRKVAARMRPAAWERMGLSRLGRGLPHVRSGIARFACLSKDPPLPASRVLPSLCKSACCRSELAYPVTDAGRRWRRATRCRRCLVRLPKVAGTWWHKRAVQDKGRASDMYLRRLSGRRGDGQLACWY
jgi:hypothetical protein